MESNKEGERSGVQVLRNTRSGFNGHSLQLSSEHIRIGVSTHDGSGFRRKNSGLAKLEENLHFPSTSYADMGSTKTRRAEE